MRLFEAKYNPWPQLRLEYMCGGSLEDQSNIPINECVRILCQCLSALVYLHENKGIVHRDIKRGNILVKYLDAGNIYKFADFGLSRESRDPTTICGSRPYLAPELIRESDRRQVDRTKRSYTSAVDIWSLGVVIFECAYDLPRWKSTGTLSWCEGIVKKLNSDLKKRPDCLKRLLSTTMVIIDPDLRCEAQDCYDQALRLAHPTDDRSQTPTLASYAQNYQQIQKHLVNEDNDDQQTIYQNTTPLGSDFNGPSPPVDNNSVASTEIRRYVRTSCPPPDSHVSASTTTRKRATWVSKSPSSSGGHQVKSRRRRAHSSNRSYQKEYDSDGGYYHKNWLRDPLWVGSSVAALGQEVSGRYDQRTVVESLDEQESTVSGIWLQDSLEEPKLAEPSQWNPPSNILSGQEHGYDYGSAFGDAKAIAPNTYLADPARRRDESGLTAEGAWHDSEAYLAAALLQGMRQA